ncbi:MAG: hypothetical protein KF892_23605 [Rhizobacter sp.]|nr:hypothetical protein [Rhizobacter sp.]
MRRLSSFLTPFTKRVVPTALVCGFAIGAVATAISGKASISAMTGFAVAIVGVLLLQKMLASDLADDVIDLGDSLLIRRGAVKEKVALANLLKAESSLATNPPRVTLYFVSAGAFGKNVSFCPAGGSTIPLAPHPFVEELMRRAEQARAKSAA